MANRTQAEPKQAKTGMSRLMQLAMTKKQWMLPSIVLSCLSAVAGFLPYLCIYKIINLLIAVFPNFDSLDKVHLINLGWSAFGGVALQMLLYFLSLACSHLAAFGTLYQLKTDFTAHVARLPLGTVALAGSGKLRKVIDENIEKIEGFIAHQMPDLVASFTAPLVMLVLLVTVDYRLGLAALAGVIIAFVIQFSLTSKAAKENMKEYQKSIEEMNNGAVEYIRGIAVVKAFKQTVHSFRRLHENISRYTKWVIKSNLDWEKPMSAFVTLINNLYLFVLPVAILTGFHDADPKLFTTKFIFYLLFVPSVAGTLMKIMYVNAASLQILVGVEAMDQYLQKAELPQPETPQKAQGFDIRFQNVSFSYDEDKEIEALSDLCFTAKQGEITAIVGPSGGGKTTIAHLIPRFFDVTSGSITLGGVDVRAMRTDDLMQHVSFVFQDVFLFKQSVRDNIVIGCPGATDERVLAAAKAAQCHDFIQKLPKGYDTIIGTQGVHLSGGERQRIAIARAILKDAPVVVLDEATAFADPENEHLIQKAFEVLLKNKTVVMIAHRLSTVQGADQLLVMDSGRLVQAGKPADLLNVPGRYQDMWETYTKTVSWKMRKVVAIK